MKNIFFLVIVFFSTTLMAREVIVKSTNDSGSETLREAITNAVANDTIIIDVKGEIILNTSISFLSDNVTIIGPYAKHNNIKAGATNMHFFDITGRAGIKFIGLGFKNSVNARVGVITNSTNISFESCVFENNSFNGAGILYFDNTSFRILSCSFLDNTAIEGGAIYVMSTGGTGGKIANSTFSSNTTTGHGGALYLNSNCFLEIVNNMFKDNSTTGLGEAIQSFDATNVVDFYSNVFELNGVNQQVNGNGSLNDISGNVIVINFVGESHPFVTAGSEYGIGTDLELTGLVEDGYGLKYYRIESGTSVLVNNGSVPPSTLNYDCRRVGRALSSMPFSSNPTIDSGPFEFTPFTVESAVGANSFENIMSDVNSATNGDPVLYVDFDILGYTSAIEFDVTAQITVNKSVVIDGYSQETTAIAGPQTDGVPGVTPAENLINITSSAGIASGLIFNNSDNVISGLSFYGFDQNGLKLFTVATDSHVFGNHFGFSGNVGSYVGDENKFTGVSISSNGTKVGGNSHYERNVITGNGQTGASTFNCNILFTNNVTSAEIVGNFIGIAPDGVSNIAGVTGTGYGIFLQGENVQCSNIIIGNSLYGGGNIISDNKSHGIYLYQVGTGNVIDNNIIGLGFDGSTVFANAQNGIYAVGSVNQVKIGDKKGNVISGNTSSGINLQASSNFLITKNIIGLDSSGTTAKANSIGISLSGASNSNNIGVDTLNSNVVSGNSTHGIYVNNGLNNNILGNKIGTNKAGTVAVGNQVNGVFCEYATGTVIGGTPLVRNIISGNGSSNSQAGIKMSNNGSTVVKANYIGTDVNGQYAIPNFWGVLTENSHTVELGDVFPNHNLISGNSNLGALISSVNTQVEGNVVGLNAQLNAAIPNPTGLKVSANNIQIGTTNVNILAGNGSNGISFTTCDNCSIDRAIIGTNPSNDPGLGNNRGVKIYYSDFVKVGTNVANTICGNQTGVYIDLSDSSTVQNNYIGILPDGTILGNSDNGVYIGIDAQGHLIGGDLATQKNYISGNTNAGVKITTNTSVGNMIQGNYIGVDVTAGSTVAKPNEFGIEINDGSYDNRIGADGDVSKRNIISGNTDAGISIHDSGTTNNIIFNNYIGTTSDNLNSVDNNTGVLIEDCDTENFIGYDNNILNSPNISGNTTGVIIGNSSVQKIYNCKIGTRNDGLSVQENDDGIVIENGSFDNVIGGIGLKGNLISGNANNGIVIDDCNDNKIFGNIIGSDINGNNPINNDFGINIFGGSGNLIGSPTVGEGNLISSNSSIGVSLEFDPTNTKIQNNKFGTDLTGNAVYSGSGNSVGVQVANTTVNTISIGGDRTLNEGNLFADNGVSVHLDNTSGQGVYGNVFGVKADGSAYLGNNNACIGVYMKDGDNNRVGENNDNYRNNIANQAINVYVDHEVNTDVLGNYIGTNLTADAILTGAVVTGVGIHVDSASLNTRMFENVLSGLFNGIEINGMTTNNNTVQGNKIGTDVTGNNLLGNTNDGIKLSGASDINVIGGDVNDITQRNVISGNVYAGIEILESSTVIICGNYIGSNQNGNTVIANRFGIIMGNSENTNSVENIRVGGSDLDSMNYIVGCTENGIAIGDYFANSYILGNTIGELPSGTNGANTYAGVTIYSNANDIKVGGINTNDGNKIVNNGQSGVGINNTAVNISVVGNEIHNNGLGIDIANDGVTTNNGTGINSNMQMPIILEAFACSPTNTTQIGIGLRNLTIGQDYLIEFYDNTSGPNALGYGEGNLFLSRYTHTSINTTDTVFIDLGAVITTGNSISATVTDNGGNGSTSEFSQNFIISTQPSAPVITLTDETCNGSNDASIFIDDSGNSRAYYFAVGADIPQFNATNDTLISLNPGIYNTTYMYLNGCEVINSNQTLLAGPIPTYTTTVADDTCGLGGSIIMDATANAVGVLATTPYENITDASTQANADFTGLTAGNYGFVLHTILSGMTCVSDTAAFDVNSYNFTNSELDFVFDDFCTSNNGLVTTAPSYSNGTFSLSTNPTGATIDAVTGEISGTVVAGTQYTVDYTYGTTCLFQQSPNAIDVLDPSFSISNYCVNGEMIPAATTPGGTYSFAVAPTDGATIDATTGELINPSAGTTYSVNYNTNGGCPGSLDQDVTVFNNSPSPIITTTDSIYCNQNELIQPLSTTIGSNVNWFNSADLSNLILTDISYIPTFSDLQTGDNFIYVVNVDANGCESLPGSINLFLSDDSNIQVIDDQNVCIASDLELFATGGDAYIWYNTENKDSLTSNVLLSPVQEGIYIVDIILADGCVFTDSVSVSYIYGEECEVIIYSAFSPNNDGVNDTWEIDGIEGYAENTVTIFNRWGDIVTTIQNYDNISNFWDGTDVKSNAPVASGTYYYVVEASGTKAYSGWIQIVK